VWECFFPVHCVHGCQALPLRTELTNNTLWKKRWGTFFTLNLECYNRYNKLLFILKIVILHDGIKTIQNGVFPFSLKNKILFLFRIQKKNKKIRCFFKKKRFFNPDDNRIHVLHARTFCRKLASEIGVLEQSRYLTSIEHVLVCIRSV